MRWNYGRGKTKEGSCSSGELLMDQNFLNDLYNVADFINKIAFFGMLGWFYILKEIFMGEAGGVAGECSQAVKEAFNNMRFIVTADPSHFRV